MSKGLRNIKDPLERINTIMRREMMELEDLTKEELLKVIREYCFYQPSHRDILKAHWETVAEEANCIMAQANKESQKWAGIKTFEALKSWNDAQILFDKGLKLSEKADALFDELCETKGNLAYSQKVQ